MTPNLPKRGDQSRINKGVPFKIVDEFGQDWGTFTMTHMDVETSSGITKYNDLVTEYDHLIESGELDREKLAIRVMCDHYMLDWDIPKTVFDAKYSPENAKKLFDSPGAEWLADKIYSKARNIVNFGYLKDAKGKPTDEKNS